MKTVAFRKDVWRDEGGGYIRKGPFPKEKTSVLVTQTYRDDTTGKVILQVTAKYGDRVHYEEGGSPATVNSPPVQGGKLETDALRVSFLAVDSKGEHETGEPIPWVNKITLKHGTRYSNGAVRVSLKAAPVGTIRYSLDGSNPRTGGVYSGEIVAPPGHELLLAIAEHGGIWSEQLSVPLPRHGGTSGGEFNPDPARKAEWNRRLTRGDRRQAFQMLEIVKRLGGNIGGADIMVQLSRSDNDWIQMQFGRNIFRSADNIEQLAIDLLQQLESGGESEVTLSVARIRFDSGTALTEAAKELNEPLVSDEVKQ